MSTSFTPKKSIRRGGSQKFDTAGGEPQNQAVKLKPVKTACEPAIRSADYWFRGAVVAGAVLLTASTTPAQNLFAANIVGNSIVELTPGGGQSTFASGLKDCGLAIQGESLPVPEPPVFGLLAVGATALVMRPRRAGFRFPNHANHAKGDLSTGAPNPRFLFMQETTQGGSE